MYHVDRDAPILFAMAPSTYERELDAARRLALAAGKLVMSYVNTNKITIEKKADDSPVTSADREASELILEGLSQAFPGDVLISEEGPDNLARRERGARVWFIDPIDGTRDFIRGQSGFSVMIGLVVDRKPRLGVVYQPSGDRLYLAAPGFPPCMVELGCARPLRCSQTYRLEEVRLVASKSHRTAKIDEVKQALGIVDEFNIGSVGLKLGLIALAERDLYVNPSSKSKAWDTCAPEAILVAAGGEMSDLYGSPLVYDGPELYNSRGLVASNGILHAAVLNRLRPLFQNSK